MLEERNHPDAPAVPTVAAQIGAHLDTLTHVTEGTLNNYEAIKTAVARTVLEGLPIDAVARADVADWIRALQDSGKSSATTKNYQSLVSSALQQAVDDELIATNFAVHDTGLRARQRGHGQGSGGTVTRPAHRVGAAHPPVLPGRSGVILSAPGHSPSVFTS